MIISYSKNFVFLHIEKTGGTSVTDALSPYMHRHDLVMQNWKKFFFNQNGDALEQHSSAHTVEKFLGDDWKNFKKFSLVRDPIQIFKSSYMFSKNVYESYFVNYSDIRNIPPEGILKAYSYSKKTGQGIDGFVDYAISMRCSTTMPQSGRLGTVLNEGLVVDLSTLEVRWDSITSYLNFDHRLPILKKNATNSYLIDISEKSKIKIKKHLERDYDEIPKVTGVRWS
jgi:hypothetical protein